MCADCKDKPATELSSRRASVARVELAEARLGVRIQALEVCLGKIDLAIAALARIDSVLERLVLGLEELNQRTPRPRDPTQTGLG